MRSRLRPEPPEASSLPAVLITIRRMSVPRIDRTRCAQDNRAPNASANMANPITLCGSRRSSRIMFENCRTRAFILTRPTLRSKRGADLRRILITIRFTWHRHGIRRPSKDSDTGSSTIPLFFALSRTLLTSLSIRRCSAILQRSRQSSWNAGDGSQPPSFQGLHRSKRTIWLSQVRTDRGHPRSGAPSAATRHSAA